MDIHFFLKTWSGRRGLPRGSAVWYRPGAGVPRLPAWRQGPVPASMTPTGLLLGSLKRQSGDPLRSIGSITLVKSMLRLGLVDRLRLMIFPLILGEDGREPAFAGYPRAGLGLAATRVLDSRLVLLEHRPAG
jgi:hypothetical protein